MDTTELESFRRLLESHGSDPTRWPAGERARAVALLGRSAEARHLLAAEQAFDRLLAEAPDASASDAASSVSRLMARLPDRERLDRAQSNVVPLPRVGAAANKRPVARRSMAAEAVLLAASLVLGVLAGTTGLFDVTGLPGLAWGETVDSDASDIALGLDASAGDGGTSAEDLL